MCLVLAHDTHGLDVDATAFLAAECGHRNLLFPLHEIPAEPTENYDATPARTIQQKDTDA